jgi:hypothetical protein
MTVELPKADPLGGGELARFRGDSAPVLAQLELLEARDTLVAR